MNNNINIKNVNGYLQIDNITKDELDLDKTLNCGQAFRWHKDKDNNWIGVVGNRIWILRQYDNYIETNIKEDDLSKIIEYFNLDMSYTDEISKIDLDNFALKAYNYSKGIHILRQDLFETMVTFLMSSCNTMSNIRNIVNKLCKTYGNQITTTWNNKEYIEYSFPSIDILSKISENEFRQLGMGFRAAYLVSTCKVLKEYESYLSMIKYSDYKNAIKNLCKLNGIGSKVANCISLFSLHHTEAFPIDTHMRQIIDTEYNGSLDISKYKGLAGIIQQYMFYYKAFN